MFKKLFFLLIIFSSFHSFANEKITGKEIGRIEVNCPKLDYPSVALDKKFDGLVILNGVLDEAGKILSSSIAFENSDQSLIDAAIDNFNNCSFDKFDIAKNHVDFVFKVYRWRLTPVISIYDHWNIKVYEKSCMRPHYPSVSRRAGEQGSVLVELKNNSSGFVSNVILEKSSGFRRLDEATIIGLIGCKLKMPDDLVSRKITYNWKLEN